MGIKLHLGAFISGAGINAYIALQLAFYFLLNLLGSTNTNTLSQNTGSTVFTLQIITILAAVLIATLFKLFNLGFSFIFSPPHDFLIKENYMTKTNKMMISGAVISLVTISLTLYLLYNLNAIGTLIMTSITFAVSYYMSDRSDYEDVREAVEAYREKIKETDPEGPGSVEIFEWELGIRLNLIATIILTLLFGWLFGHIILSLVSLLTFILIRKASGGIHIKSLTLCAIVSAFIFL